MLTIYTNAVVAEWNNSRMEVQLRMEFYRMVQWKWNSYCMATVVF